MSGQAGDFGYRPTPGELKANQLVAIGDMRIEVVKREINQGALAGMRSEITDVAAALVIVALDSYDAHLADAVIDEPLTPPLVEWCPGCHAREGETCRTSAGVVRADPHKLRTLHADLWRIAENEPYGDDYPGIRRVIDMLAAM